VQRVFLLEFTDDQLAISKGLADAGRDQSETVNSIELADMMKRTTGTFVADERCQVQNCAGEECRVRLDYQFGELILIQLNRAFNDHKVRLTVNYPFKDFDPERIGQSYYLRAVICHIGDSGESGVKRSTLQQRNKWPNTRLALCGVLAAKPL